MIVAEYGAPDDGKIGVRACCVVRKLSYKIKQLFKYGSVYLHRDVVFVKNNTVLVVIYIG